MAVTHDFFLSSSSLEGGYSTDAVSCRHQLVADHLRLTALMLRCTGTVQDVLGLLWLCRSAGSFPLCFALFTRGSGRLLLPGLDLSCWSSLYLLQLVIGHIGGLKPYVQECCHGQQLVSCRNTVLSISVIQNSLIFNIIYLISSLRPVLSSSGFNISEFQ